MRLFSKKNKTSVASIQTSSQKVNTHPFSQISRYCPGTKAELDLYSSLREAVPIIDAAIDKLVRLLGTFEVRCDEARYSSELERFVRNVALTGGNRGLHSFIYSYFDQLLTYGTAVGEMVPASDMRGISALYNASLYDVSVVMGESPLETMVCKRDLERTVAERQELILTTLLNPKPGTVEGTSILKGLPFVSSILLKILQSIGTNWERAGNIRYAVTYNPGDSSVVNAKQYAEDMAREWSRAMRDDSRVCDFVSVGDVSVKVIGADSQILDCDIPVKRITEQIVSKLSIPPFLLGLSWSSTERMSSVQADILTSEIEYYRTILTPVIERICREHLILFGANENVTVEWSNISLQDEESLAEARLNNARAKQIESNLEVKA